MKSILAAAIIILLSFECGAQEQPISTSPAKRGKTVESAAPAGTPKSPGARVVAPSYGRVISTQTLTITASSASQPFTPVMIETATLTITASNKDAAFSPVNIKTQTLTITAGSGGN